MAEAPEALPAPGGFAEPRRTIKTPSTESRRRLVTAFRVATSEVVEMFSPLSLLRNFGPIGRGSGSKGSLRPWGAILSPAMEGNEQDAGSDPSRSTGALGAGRKAVCLVSGGMDSAVVLAEAVAQGFEAYALSFRYGQRHDIELEAAGRVAQALGAVDHRTVAVDLSTLGGSALTDDIAVPKDRTDESIGQGVPATYVPARNTIFLSVALGWAEVLGATDLFVGVNAVDYSGYPDCRPEFIAAFERLADLATAAGAEGGASFQVHAPLMELSKAGIVHRAAELNVDLGLTHTCYDPVDGKSCGRCDACVLRLAGFAEAGAVDPIPYVEGVVQHGR